MYRSVVFSRWRQCVVPSVHPPNGVSVCSSVIGNESAPIQLAQCRFPGLAISNAKIQICFWNKIYGSNFIKQHSETIMVWNYQNADCGLRKKNYCVIYYHFRHSFVPYAGLTGGPDAHTSRSLPSVLVMRPNNRPLISSVQSNFADGRIAAFCRSSRRRMHSSVAGTGQWTRKQCALHSSGHIKFLLALYFFL